MFHPTGRYPALSVVTSLSGAVAGPSWHSERPQNTRLEQRHCDGVSEAQTLPSVSCPTEGDVPSAPSDGMDSSADSVGIECQSR
jgi:hypothetical protein